MTGSPSPIVRETARSLLSRGQAVGLAACVVLAVVGVIVHWRATTVVLICGALIFYCLHIGLKLAVQVAAVARRPGAERPPSTADSDLPRYTVLVPLYQEAHMLPRLVQSLAALDYPSELLQVLLLLEEDDSATRAEAVALALPPWFEVVVVPDLPPKGKPKALNVGLQHATGSLCVVYDAEDRPDPDQLRTAVATFRGSPDDVACLQARLVFWNEDTSWVTRFYWAEYVVHFEWVVAGLARLGLVAPLGGTSNHFRTSVLREIAFDPDKLPVGAEGVGAWDPWNVTEDAELAGALALHGYRVAMLDSVTSEEATARLGPADRQRRRWLKGFLQTGLVYTRSPLRTARRMGPMKWACYTLVTLGTPLSLLLNPIFWTLTVVYFTTRSATIEALFPAPLFYVGLLLLVGGNLLLFYQLVIACLHRESYGTVRYLLLVPLWWAFTSWSAYRVLLEVARPSTRHVWHKTPHGHDLSKELFPAGVGPGAHDAVPAESGRHAARPAEGGGLPRTPRGHGIAQ
jgi:cellulose synthase/poly-beta-1,6-N-acetylglucosamine synthase-like glycosyltransferase